MTREELELITDIRDFTTLLTLFCVILRRETSNSSLRSLAVLLGRNAR